MPPHATDPDQATLHNKIDATIAETENASRPA